MVVLVVGVGSTAVIDLVESWGSSGTVSSWSGLVVWVSDYSE